MSDNILSALCRAMLARDNDRTSACLSGVAIDPTSDLVRCEATNGKILAVCHAYKAGVELNAPVVICAAHIPRLINFHSRNRRALEDIACRRDATKADRPLITVRQIDGDTAGTKVLEFAIPRLDDVCRVQLVKANFPNVKPQETKGKVWKIGIGGAHFDLRMLSLIPKILPHGFMPYTTGKQKTIWKSQRDSDYVLVMPISVPDEEAAEIFP